MYYHDLVAVAEKKITSSNFCCLVDVAVMLYEEEHRKGKSKCHMNKKILSEKVEESDNRFFHLFPRKTRTSVKKFVSRTNTQQNLNGPSSSLFLGDYKTTADSQNPPFSSSSSLFLGDYKIKAESEKRNPRNPSSSSLFLGDYKITAESEKRNPQKPPPSSSSSSSSLFLEIAAGSEKAEMRNSRNPNSQSSPSSCLTENKSLKKRAEQESKRNGKSKKAKVDTFSWKGRETPEWLIELMRDMNGSDLRLIFQRTLFKTDVNPGESRLSMLFNELIRKDFLTPVESIIIEEDINNDKKMGVGAILLDQRTVKWGVILKRWEMKKDWNYALTCGWNDIVKANGLRLGDDISIWSFRWCGLLCFALVTPSMAQM